MHPATFPPVPLYSSNLWQPWISKIRLNIAFSISFPDLPGANVRVKNWTSTKFHLTHWGRVMHICVGKITIIVSDNVLYPLPVPSHIWTNAGLLLIGPLGTNFSEILIEILIFSFTKMRLKLSSAKWRPFRLGLDELMSGSDLVTWKVLWYMWTPCPGNHS